MYYLSDDVPEADVECIREVSNFTGLLTDAQKVVGSNGLDVEIQRDAAVDSSKRIHKCKHSIQFLYTSLM